MRLQFGIYSTFSKEYYVPKAYLLSDHMDMPVNHTIALHNTLEGAIAMLGGEIVQKFSETTAAVRIPKTNLSTLNIPSLDYRAIAYDKGDYLENLVLSEYPLVTSQQSAGHWFSAYQQQVLA